MVAFTKNKAVLCGCGEAFGAFYGFVILIGLQEELGGQQAPSLSPPSLIPFPILPGFPSFPQIAFVQLREYLSKRVCA
jgi:hypothetical protein